MGFVTADMNLPLERLDVINLFAEDLAGTRSFYQEVLGSSLAFEDERAAVFKLENVMVCLSEVTGAAELIAPTAVAGPGAGARFVLTVFVDDVDAACIELARHGVVLLNGPVDRPWGMRTASFADPAGHIREIAQDLEWIGATGPGPSGDP